MTLYLYQVGKNTPMAVLQDILTCTDETAVAADGTIYGPFAEDCELSRTEDCSETLRADWRSTHPTTDARLEELEFLLADLLFGGEAE